MMWDAAFSSSAVSNASRLFRFLNTGKKCYRGFEKFPTSSPGVVSGRTGGTEENIVRSTCPSRWLLA